MSYWDPRMMFEFYLYDYLRKNNMHQTAEALREESDYNFDILLPPAVDVPDGFLLEWWLAFYEMWRAQNVEDGPPAKKKRNMQHNSICLSRQPAMNEQMFKCLANFSGSNLSRQEGQLSSKGRHLAGTGHILQGFCSSEYQEELKPCKSALLSSLYLEEAQQIPSGLEKFVLGSSLVAKNHQDEFDDKSPLAEIFRQTGKQKKPKISGHGSNSLPEYSQSTSAASCSNYKGNGSSAGASSIGNSVIDYQNVKCEKEG